MLLMPPEVVRTAVRQVGGEIDSPESVLAIARRLRTSFTATLEHLSNWNCIQEVVRDRIRLAVEPGIVAGA
jgi:hypothetical protein